MPNMFDTHPDYVRVIRCRDCAVPHNIWTGCPKMNGTIMPPHGYCYYGVPKYGGKPLHKEEDD